MEGFEFQYIGKPAEWIDGWVSDLILGHDWHKNAKGTRHSAKTPEVMRLTTKEFAEADKRETTKFVLVCPDERGCRYRRVVSYRRASDVIAKAWRKGSHKLIGTIDL